MQTAETGASSVCGANRLPADSVERAARAFAELHQYLHAQQQSCWEDLDLTMSQFKALMLIAATGGLSGRDLARRFGVGPSAVTAIVEKLVQRGYVRREEDAHDRRISWTRPMPAALALFQQVNSGHDEQVTGMLRLLAPDEVALVARALCLLRDAGTRWLANTQAPLAGAQPEAATRAAIADRGGAVRDGGAVRASTPGAAKTRASTDPVPKPAASTTHPGDDARSAATTRSEGASPA